MELVTIRRLHRATGLFPLGAYLIFHAWEHWPVRSGRGALFSRLSYSHNTLLEVVLLLLPLLVHALLGMYLARRPDGRPAYASPAFHRLQVASGIAALLFIAFHVLGVWLPRVIEQNPLGASYNALRAQAGTMVGLALYVLGLAAVCTHFGQGLGVALAGLTSGRIAPVYTRAVGVLLGVALYLVFVNELASYATGARLL
jgi:succinate dehydrogenase/fumarate reductase cytochrome b subunit